MISIVQKYKNNKALNYIVNNFFKPTFFVKKTSYKNQAALTQFEL
jgi:hypothetical protein